MAGKVATISGTMLTPGVSRNKRLYTREVIASAAKRMQERIADPMGLPIVMRSHHAAGDDSVRIVGALRSVTVGEDGSASYAADLFDTTHGRDIATLVVPGKGQPPALRSVSIHGYWLGPVKTVTYEGESVSTASDLEVDAVDFTASPGVLGATVDSATWVRPGDAAESTSGRTPISESMEATVEAVTEDAPVQELSAKAKRAALAKGQAMKNADGEPAYPIKSKAQLRKAIRAVGRGGADHDKIRAFIIKRAAAMGLSALIPDTWNKDGSMNESTTRYSDVREYYPDGPGGAAGFCIDAYNGPTSLTIRNCSIDPADLRVIAAAAMDAAINALQAVDPDMDGDVDVPGAPAEDTDDDMDGTGETAVTAAAPVVEAVAPPARTVTEALPQTPSPSTGAVTTTTEEEAAMGEPTPTTETAAPARSFTDEDLKALGAIFGVVLKENLAPVLAAVSESAPKAGKKTKATETAPAPVVKEKSGKKALAETVAELQASMDAKLAEALAKQRDELRESMLKEYGTPQRQGFRVHENDKAPDNIEDLYADRANIMLGAIGIPAAPVQ
jgi:hypothetical protein